MCKRACGRVFVYVYGCVMLVTYNHIVTRPHNRHSECEEFNTDEALRSLIAIQLRIDLLFLSIAACLVSLVNHGVPCGLGEVLVILAYH